MSTLLTLEIRAEHDVVLARQRARQVAELLGFDRQDQTRVAAVVSEIVRNAYQHAAGGRVDFGFVGDDARALDIIVRDRGPGIGDLRSVLDGRVASSDGSGQGLVGARRVMDRFEITSVPGAGSTVRIG